MNRLRFLLAGLFLSFLICYLEWAGNNSGFIFQLEYQIFEKAFNGSSILHPLIIIPFIGQMIILVSIFLPKPNKKLILFGTISLGILVLMILLVGILSTNIRIVLMTIPFFVFAFLVIKKRTSSSAIEPSA